VKQECKQPVLLNPQVMSDSSIKLLLEYDDMTIDNIATTLSAMELDGVIGYNEGCIPGNLTYL
jgi:hypothetical protein